MCTLLHIIQVQLLNKRHGNVVAVAEIGSIIASFISLTPTAFEAKTMMARHRKRK